MRTPVPCACPDLRVGQGLVNCGLIGHGDAAQESLSTQSLSRRVFGQVCLEMTLSSSRFVRREIGSVKRGSSRSAASPR